MFKLIPYVTSPIGYYCSRTGNLVYSDSFHHYLSKNNTTLEEIKSLLNNYLHNKTENHTTSITTQNKTIIYLKQIKWKGRDGIFLSLQSENYILLLISYLNLIDSIPAIILNDKDCLFISSTLKTQLKPLGNPDEDIPEKQFCAQIIPNIQHKHTDLPLLFKTSNNYLYFDYKHIDVDTNIFDNRLQIVLLYDITPYKIRELSSVSQSRTYEMIVESANEAIVIAQDNKLVYANKHVELLTGYDHDELMAKSFLSFIHPEDREKALKYHLKRMSGDFSPQEYSLRIITKPGFEKEVMLKTIPIQWNGKFAGLVFLVNFDERKIAEAALIHAQKMELAGRTALSIFHDLNNILTIIKTNAELLEMFKGQKLNSSHITHIIEATDQASGLINQINFFKGYRETEKQILDLDSYLKHEKSFFEKIVKRKIELEITISAGKKFIFVDPVHLKQILTNLILNAQDAILELNQRGKITIRTKLALNSKPKLKRGTLKKGNYAILSIKDNGIGIEEEQLDHVFEPFFSTKSSATNSGMGLAIVSTIMQNINGGIDIKSAKMKGTEIQLYFPIASSKLQFDSSSETSDISPQYTKRTILYIEPDNKIRDIIYHILEKHNFQVYAFDSIETALPEIENSSSIDLIISEFELPGKDIFSLLKNLPERIGQIPLVLTGNQLTELDDYGHSNTVILPKPYGVKQLLKTIESVFKER
ncbi:MAG: hypothetical protein Kow00108_09010 [Calditrichia bacterium]